LKHSGALVTSFKQNYLSYTYHGSPIKIPAVHVRLINPVDSSRELNTFALVDSGATVSFLPLELAEILELKLGDKSEAVGAGGIFDTYISKLKVEVTKGSSVKYRDEIEVQVPQEKEKIPYFVLGRNSIFLHFNVTIKETKQHVIFRRV